MSSLTQLQHDFQAYLLDDTAPQGFAKAIVNDAKVGARKRLQIYHDAYRLRIIEVLGNVYPNVQKLLSAAQFERVARGYITAYPSTYRNMRWVGDQFDAYLRQALPQNPLAAEMAQFEWALGLAFDAEDAPLLAVQDLASIAPENWGALRFDWHPAVQIFAINHHVIQIWQALEQHNPLPKLKPQAAYCLVWRQDMMSHFRNLDDAEHAAIQTMMSGKTFGELCEQLAESMDEEAAVAQAAGYLATWLNEGLISNFHS